MRTLIAGPLLVLACTHTPASGLAASGHDAGDRVDALAERYFEDLLRADPLFASLIGDHRYDDRLPDDLSPAGREATRAVHERARAELMNIDRAQLSGQALL